MAKLPTFLLWGQSNMQGSSNLQAAPSADFTRWAGQAFSVGLANLPYDVSVPGVWYWTPTLAHGLSTQYAASKDLTITFPGGTGLTVTLAPNPNWSADAYKGRYLWVNAAGGGEQLRQILSNTNDTLTLKTALSPAVPTGGVKLDIWQDGYRLKTGNGGAKTVELYEYFEGPPGPGTGASLTPGAWTNKWLIFTSGLAVGQAFKIIGITGTTIYLSGWPSPFDPAEGDGVRVYTGGGISSLADYTASNAGFKALRFFYDGKPSLSTGLDYPNHLTLPLPSTLGYSTYTRMGPDLELSWHLQHEYDGDVFIIKVGVGSAYMSRYLAALPNTTFSWYDPSIHNDWHPSSTNQLTKLGEDPVYDLFDVLMTTILTAAKNWVAQNRPGDVLDIQGIFGMEGESDSTSEVLANLTGVNMRLIRDTMRQRIRDLEVSSRDPSRIPFIIGLVRGTDSVWPYAETTNANFTQLAEDDLFTGVVDTGDLTVNPAPDQAHYDPAGQIEFGKRLFAKWQEIRNRESTATTEEEKRLSLAGLRTRVLRRYERNDVSNQSLQVVLDQFINDSLREVLNTIGDNAWFMRRIDTIQSLGDTLNPVELPKAIKRVLRIESQTYIGTQLPWRIVGQTGNGRIKIILESNTTGPYDVHHVIQQAELVGDDDMALIPMDYSELVVMLACKRLAESGGNAQMADYYNNEVQRLFAYVKRDCQRYDRGRKAEMSVDGTPDRWAPPAWGRIY